MSALLLASGSPRRRELLGRVGLTVTVVPPDVDETRRPGEAAVAYARRLAECKVSAVDTADGEAALAADTVVHRGDAVWGKPEDRRDAIRILRALSGDWHAVTTAFAVRRGAELFVDAVTTEVRFRRLSEAEILAYVATGEADDKAGAYGIQGAAGSFVAELRGSWTNVMGLPLEEVLAALSAFGVTPVEGL